MRFAFLRKATVVGAVASVALLGGLAAPAAASGSTATPLQGGTTTVTTGPGIARTLLSNGILPVATAPGRQSFGFTRSGLNVSFSFPVTGGAVDLDTLAGTIEHRGGIVFYNLRNGKKVKVSDFVIDTRAGVLTARVNGGARAPIFQLDLSAATVDANGNRVRVGNIDVTLTDVAASALNGALGTRLFTPGLDLGTARTSLRV